jgi:hypothetical protein
MAFSRSMRAAMVGAVDGDGAAFCGPASTRRADFTEPSGKHIKGPLPCASLRSISQGCFAQRLAMSGSALNMVGM